MLAVHSLRVRHWAASRVRVSSCRAHDNVHHRSGETKAQGVVVLQLLPVLLIEVSMGMAVRIPLQADQAAQCLLGFLGLQGFVPDWAILPSCVTGCQATPHLQE